MAQYGGDQQFGRQTDEYGNPVYSATGGQYGQEFRQTDEYGNPVRKTEEYGNPVHSATGGTMGDYGSTGRHQGLGQDLGGTGTGSYGTTGQHQGLGTDLGYGTGHQGLGSDIGHGTRGTGGDYSTGGRSTGQTGYQGLGTELGTGGTTGSYQNQPSATPMGGAGIGTVTGDRYGGSNGTHEKGMMEKIKEKIPGGQQQQHTAGGGVHGETGQEKKGVLEKIKEKLPGHH